MESNGQRFDFLDHLAKKNLSAYESRVLLTILKCHLVYNNGGVIISLSRIVRATELSESHVCRSLRGLIQKQAIIKTQKNGLPFYSLTPPIEALPIKAGEPPIQAEGGLPIQARKLPIKAGVIRSSKDLKDLNINNNRGTETKEAEDRFKTFFDEYPGAWHKGIEKKAREKFLILTPSDQETALKAVHVYKKSNTVKEKRILSPINFISSPKLFKKYAADGDPVKRAGQFDTEAFEKMKKNASEPPKGGLLKMYDEEIKGKKNLSLK